MLFLRMRIIYFWGGRTDISGETNSQLITSRLAVSHPWKSCIFRTTNNICRIKVSLHFFYLILKQKSLPCTQPVLCGVEAHFSRTVMLSLELNYVFLGSFDPTTTIVYYKNGKPPVWANQYISHDKITALEPAFGLLVQCISPWETRSLLVTHFYNCSGQWATISPPNIDTLYRHVTCQMTSCASSKSCIWSTLLLRTLCQKVCSWWCSAPLL